MLILEHFLKDLKEEKEEIYIIDNHQFQFPLDFGIYANSEGNVSLLYKGKTHRNIYYINEKFSRNSIHRYLKYLDKSQYTLNLTEPVSIVNRFVDELREKIEGNKMNYGNGSKY